METTLLSRTNSSNCSRRDCGMCAFTWAVRFSRLMKKKPPRPEGPRGGVQQGFEEEVGGPCWLKRCYPLSRGLSCEGFTSEDVRTNYFTRNAKLFFISHGHFRADLAVAVLMTANGGLVDA